MSINKCVLSINGYVLSLNVNVYCLYECCNYLYEKERYHPARLMVRGRNKVLTAILSVLMSPDVLIEIRRADEHAGSWILPSVATKRPPTHKEGIIPVSQQGTLNHTVRVFTRDADPVTSCCWDKACVYHEGTQ